MEHLASHTLRHHSGHVILHRDKPGASFMAQEETLMYNEKGQLVGNRRGNLDGTCKIPNRRNVRMSPLTNYAMRDHCFLGEGYNFMPCYVMLCYVMLRYFTLRHVTLRYAMLCYAMFMFMFICVTLPYLTLCYVYVYVMLCYVMSCHVMS